MLLHRDRTAITTFVWCIRQQSIHVYEIKSSEQQLVTIPLPQADTCPMYAKHF